MGSEVSQYEEIEMGAIHSKDLTKKEQKQLNEQKKKRNKKDYRPPSPERMQSFVHMDVESIRHPFQDYFEFTSYLIPELCTTSVNIPFTIQDARVPVSLSTCGIVPPWLKRIESTVIPVVVDATLYISLPHDSDFNEECSNRVLFEEVLNNLSEPKLVENVETSLTMHSHMYYETLMQSVGMSFPTVRMKDVANFCAQHTDIDKKLQESDVFRSLQDIKNVQLEDAFDFFENITASIECARAKQFHTIELPWKFCTETDKYTRRVLCPHVLFTMYLGTKDWVKCFSEDFVQNHDRTVDIYDRSKLHYFLGLLCDNYPSVRTFFHQCVDVQLYVRPGGRSVWRVASIQYLNDVFVAIERLRDTFTLFDPEHIRLFVDTPEDIKRVPFFSGRVEITFILVPVRSFLPDEDDFDVIIHREKGNEDKKDK